MRLKGRPIFIHSLFRTGSTYLWNKFRRIDGYHCYYEPLHPDLKNLSLAKPYVWNSSTQTTELMRHPVLDRNKHAEYQPLLVEGHQGVPFFKDSFSYDEYCENGQNPDLKRYIDFLIEHAGDKTPVFKFNRSALRIRWFKENYPSGIHLYLLRDPRDQWASYNNLSPPEVRELFLSTDLLIVSLNRDSAPLKPLTNCVPLIHVHAENAEGALSIYGELLAVYSQKERYLVFYYLWLVSLLENLLFSDLALSIDLLSTDLSYREKLRTILASFQIQAIDFDDAQMKAHATGTLSPTEMAEVESNAQAMISRSMEPKDIEEALLAGRRYAGFGLDLEGRFKTARGPSRLEEDARPDPGEALAKKIEPLARGLASRRREIKTVKAELKENRALLEENRALITRQSKIIQKMETDILQKERQLSVQNARLSQTERALSDVLNSYTFMVGRVVLSPLQFILGLIAWLRGQGGSR
jgi:hypothetical protein